MISIHQLSEHIEDLDGPHPSLADFEDWFASESWGSYDVAGDNLSNAIAAVHHVLYNYETGVFDDNRAKTELAAAIHPFVPRANAIHLVFAQALGAEPVRFQPANYYRRWNMMLLAANENAANPAWITISSSNSTVPPISSQRETESAFGSALAKPPAMAAAL